MPSRALNGLAAAAVAVGVTQLVAAPFGHGADALNAVGSSVIDLTPGPLKEWAIQTFGTADKLFLSIAMLAVIAAVAAAAGSLETRRRPIGSALIALAGVVGCAAILSRPGGGLFDVIPTVVGTACGIVLTCAAQGIVILTLSQYMALSVSFWFLPCSLIASFSALMLGGAIGGRRAVRDGVEEALSYQK